MKRVAPLILCIFAGIARGQSQPAADGRTVVRFETDEKAARIPFLSWDTESGDRSSRNLLRSPVVLRWKAGDKFVSSPDVAFRRESADAPARGYELSVHGVRYTIAAGPNSELSWAITQPGSSTIRVMKISSAGSQALQQVELVFPFDPRVTPTTVLPAANDEDNHFRLPAIISAPDFGQMLLKSSVAGVRGRLEGSRAEKVVDLVIEIPADGCNLEWSPVRLPAPEGLHDLDMWRAVRRGWFNALQATARWGDPKQAFSSPPGLLGNNVLSDPASVALHFYADQAMWTPQLAPGISVMEMVRRTVDFWLDQRTRPTGEVVGYWAYGDFLDANVGPLIAAWDYVEATGDREWLGRRIGRLEFVADFLAKRDIDDDGLIEATQSGNKGTLQQPNRSCAWWDALNCGHKDAYCNAFIYRAFRCLADLEKKAGRKEQCARYTKLADRLKAACFKTLYNEKTGWLAWWKSKDGELHDYAAPTVNGLAIEYGLVPPAQGREILERLHAKMKKVGFTHFELGLPGTLVPVPRADYLLPDAIGCPKRDDGTDTFQQYMNGGISAGHTLHFLAAHYVLGMPEKADVILRAMLARQAREGFHNGVRDAAMQGIDWTTWDGKPCGYEGYLSDVFRFFQAVLLREEPFRSRYYRPLMPTAD